MASETKEKLPTDVELKTKLSDDLEAAIRPLLRAYKSSGDWRLFALQINSDRVTIEMEDLEA